MIGDNICFFCFHSPHGPARLARARARLQNGSASKPLPVFIWTFVLRSATTRTTDLEILRPSSITVHSRCTISILNYSHSPGMLACRWIQTSLFWKPASRLCVDCNRTFTVFASQSVNSQHFLSWEPILRKGGYGVCKVKIFRLNTKTPRTEVWVLSPQAENVTVINWTGTYLWVNSRCRTRTSVSARIYASYLGVRRGIFVVAWPPFRNISWHAHRLGMIRGFCEFF